MPQQTPQKPSFKPGIYNIPDEKYFAAEGVNASTLKDIMRSPAYCKYRMENPKEPTPQMIEGTALHCAILEPKSFNTRFAVLPDNAPLRPTEKMIAQANPSEDIRNRIQFWSVFDQESKGKILLKNEQAAKLLEAANTVRGHPELAPFLRGGKAEYAVFGKDPESGLLCKIKPDYLNQIKKYKVMLEVKSTDDARPAAFQRTAYNFGYWFSAAFYCSVMEWSKVGRPDIYLVVAVEREEPWGTKIYEIPDEAMEFGERQYRKALDLYKYCTEMGEWPNYDTTIDVLTLPPWAREET